MPPPGRRNKKTKAKAKPVRDLSSVDVPTVLDSQLDRINDASSWNTIVDTMCDIFELPDLDSRKGLRIVHNNFIEVQCNLNNVYSKYRDNYKVTGAIVGMWSKMSRDAILRNKIWDSGLLAKLLPLLDDSRTRVVGLEALSCVTCSGGVEIRQEVLKQTPTLRRLMDAFPDDSDARDEIVVILSHAVSAAINITKSTSSATAIGSMTVYLSAAVDCVFQAVKKPDFSMHTLTHAIDLFSIAALGCPSKILADPSLVNLLVALLRAEHIFMRTMTLVTLIRLAAYDCEADHQDFDTKKALESLRNGLPESLVDHLIDYVPAQSQTFTTLNTVPELMEATTRYAQDGDICALGFKISSLIVMSEYVVGRGNMETLNERTGRREKASLPGRLPLTFPDLLIHCADAIRAPGTNPTDLEAADILECKFHTMCRHVDDAVQLAQRATERNPQTAYFYYVTSLTIDHVLGLKAAKKGLRARKTTVSLRQNLLCRAVTHAVELGLERLQHANSSDTAHEEGVAFLKSALDDAATFCEETPPDNRRMPNILNWYILLSIAMLGPNISVNLEELKKPFAKLDSTRVFSKFFGYPDRQTQSCVAREMVIHRYRRAYTEWRSQIDHVNSLGPPDAKESFMEATLKADDNLTVWLNGSNSKVDEEDRVYNTHSCHWICDSSATRFYRCSYCGNPSAALRKCSACKKTLYCDASCQTLHWPEHKVACKVARAHSPGE